MSADPVMDQPGSANFADTPEDSGLETDGEAGTEGGTTARAGVNGSRARLPYGLDPARTPVLGSWRSGTQQTAALRSAWYRLPPRDSDEEPPLLAVAAAGRFDPGEVAGAVGHRRRARPPTNRAAPSGSPTSAPRPPGAICGPRWRRSRARPP